MSDSSESKQRSAKPAHAGGVIDTSALGDATARNSNISDSNNIWEKNGRCTDF